MNTYTAAFKKALAFVLAQEGGYTNDPVDPGGATNLGILQPEYNTYRKGQGLPLRSVQYITNDEAAAIYYNKYWNTSQAGLPAPSSITDPGLALVMFDTAVNPRTGVWDKIKTILAKPNKTDAERSEQIIQAREALYRQRVVEKPSQIKFLKGWLNRMKNLRSAISSPGPVRVADADASSGGAWTENEGPLASIARQAGDVLNSAGAAIGDVWNQGTAAVGGAVAAANPFANFWPDATTFANATRESIAKGMKDAAVWLGFIVVVAMLLLIIVRGE